jgi:hypothetical protein
MLRSCGRQMATTVNILSTNRRPSALSVPPLIRRQITAWRSARSDALFVSSPPMTSTKVHHPFSTSRIPKHVAAAWPQPQTRPRSSAALTSRRNRPAIVWNRCRLMAPSRSGQFGDLVDQGGRVITGQGMATTAPIRGPAIGDRAWLLRRDQAAQSPSMSGLPAPLPTGRPGGGPAIEADEIGGRRLGGIGEIELERGLQIADALLKVSDLSLEGIQV